ncbi:MAG: cell division ATP-binding protein FtsE [Brevibacterium sp.]
MIKFDSVSKSYDTRSRKALDDITFEADRGEFVFLVGASGSGKSTVIRLILREEVPTTGRIHIAGKSVVKMPSWKVPYLRRGIGTVFQDFRLLPNKTVFANVAFALQVIPNELSGGEQQRVAIARAVVNKPGILLADEPTGNLDPTTSADIMNVLEKINRNGTTVLMATHDGEIVNRMRRRVIELREGTIVRDVEEGTYGVAS